jgi:hypothetical protein
MRASRPVLVVLAWSLAGLVSCQGDGDPSDDGIQQPRVRDIGPISDWPGRVDAGVGSDPVTGGVVVPGGGPSTMPPPQGGIGGGAAGGATMGGTSVGGGTTGGGTTVGGLTGGGGAVFDAGAPSGVPNFGDASTAPIDAGAPADADLGEDAAQDGAADGSTDDASHEPECLFGWLGRGCRRPARDP